jgi:hypothetical protein
VGFIPNVDKSVEAGSLLALLLAGHIISLFIPRIVKIIVFAFFLILLVSIINTASQNY